MLGAIIGFVLIIVGVLVYVMRDVIIDDWKRGYEEGRSKPSGSSSTDNWQAGANVGRALFGSKGTKSCRSCGKKIPLHAGKCPHCHEETKYYRSILDHLDS